MKNTRPGWRPRAYAAVLTAAACGSCTSHVDGKDSKDTKDSKDRQELASAALAKCLLEDPQSHPEPLVITCPKHSCGQSAKIYSSFIEALDTHGEQVQDLLDEPFRLVRETLIDAGGGCRGLPGLSLEVRDGGFVGVTGGPAQAVVRCDGMDLVGARFQLEQRTTRPPNRKRFIVQIAARGTVDAVGGQDGSFPTYDLVSHAVVAPGAPASVGQHLCEPGRWGHPLESPTRHALLVQGETYRRDATVHHRGARWFNVGCAGSALAKMRLHGLDPMKNRPSGSTTTPVPGDSTTEMRQATLKMLTAKYCNANSWTKDGTPIYWLGEGEGSLLPRPVWPGADRSGPVESRWGGNGALCISHLRLWSLGSECAKSSEAELVARIQRTCGIPACDETTPCLAPASPEGATVWRTCTVDHVPHRP